MPGNVALQMPDSERASAPPTTSLARVVEVQSSGESRAAFALLPLPVPLFRNLRTEMQRHEANLIWTALQLCHGNQTHAARLLCLPRRTLVYKLAALRKARPEQQTP